MIKCPWCRVFKCKGFTKLTEHIKESHPDVWKQMNWSYGSGPGTLAGNEDL